MKTAILILPVVVMKLQRAGDEEVEVDNPTGEPREELFFCGDVRSNEAIGLLAIIITLFLREHDRRAAEYLKFFPNVSPPRDVFDDLGGAVDLLSTLNVVTVCRSRILYVTYHKYLLLVHAEVGK